MHLRWELPTGEPLVEAAAVLRVEIAPRVERLYFWALQVSFAAAGSRHTGAAHVGLQWAPHPRALRCVNWGGYRAPAEGGGELDGSPSELPSTMGNPNTRDYDWAPQRDYRLRVLRAGEGRWRAEVVDLAAGRSTGVRDLYAPGDRLADPVVWSEVFARCDDPTVSVRWSALEGVTASGRRVAATAVITSYQSAADGGCDNTTARPDGDGVLQVTAADRIVPPGARIVLG